MKNCEHFEARNEVMNQNAYLRRQFGELMKQKRKEIRSSPSTMSSEFTREGEDEDEHHPGGSSIEEEPMRHPRRRKRHQPNLNDIKVEVPEFEGRLDPDEFLE